MKTKSAIRRELDARLDEMLSGKIAPAYSWEDAVVMAYVAERPSCPAKTFDELVQYLEERPAVVRVMIAEAAQLVSLF